MRILDRLVLLCLLYAQVLLAENHDSSKISLDFVDTPIADVARSISIAYDVSILVENGVESLVTFHLENISLMEGLAALCETNGLQLIQEENVLKIALKVNRGENYFALSDSGVTLSVKDKDLGEFVSEYGANTGLNILLMEGVQGKISGALRDIDPQRGLVYLMNAHGFEVRKLGSCFMVEKKNESLANTEGHLDIEEENGLYTVKLEGVSLAHAVKEIANVAQLNVAVYGDVQEKVWVQLSNVKLKELLNALFRGSRYTYELDSNSLFISELGAKKALSASKLFPLKYIHSEKALAQLTKFFPGNDFVASEVKEQNALLLGGSLSEMNKAEAILTQVDVPPLQVTLSCLLVEFKKGRNFELGMHSGAGRKTGEYDIGVKGFYDFLGKDISKSGSFGKIGILPDRFELELASLEENNKAEVLARPRLTTLNGNKAELNVTNTVYYLVSQVSADGYPITDYRSFNDGISLELTPSMTQDGLITLEISPEIKTAGRSSGDGPRDISTRNLKTTVVLERGQTLCLGGIIRKTKSEVKSAVPFLGSLPLIGRLFSYVSDVEEESELAIFITPEVD